MGLVVKNPPANVGDLQVMQERRPSFHHDRGVSWVFSSCGASVATSCEELTHWKRL